MGASWTQSSRRESSERMKRTHMSVGVYDRNYHVPGRRTREKHNTACGTVCDNTKATTDRLKVTCKFCLKRVM